MNDMVFDFSDFKKKFGIISRQIIPELLEKGLGRAMLQMLNDCVMEIPTVPLKEGWLRGSGSIFVQNKFIMSSENAPSAKQGYSNKSYSEATRSDRLIGVIGYNTPYAARVHEGITFHFTEPSSGAKYLESKLLRNRENYMLIIANTVRMG